MHLRRMPAFRWPIHTILFVINIVWTKKMEYGLHTSYPSISNFRNLYFTFSKTFTFCFLISYLIIFTCPIRAWQRTYIF